MRVMFLSNEMDPTSFTICDVHEVLVTDKISVRTGYNANQTIRHDALLFKNKSEEISIYLVGQKERYREICTTLFSEECVNLMGFKGIYLNPEECDIERIKNIISAEAGPNGLINAIGLAAPLK